MYNVYETPKSEELWLNRSRDNTRRIMRKRKEHQAAKAAEAAEPTIPFVPQSDRIVSVFLLLLLLTGAAAYIVAYVFAATR